MSIASEGRPGVAQAATEIDLGGLGRALWRKKFWIVGLTLLAAGLAFAIVNFITPRYKSEARVLVDALVGNNGRITVNWSLASDALPKPAVKTLLNLELRPRRVRDAANLWAAVRTAKGVEERDAVWSHPDLVPTGADLDDPLGFAAHGHVAEQAAAELDDLDAALARLIEEERGGEGPRAD